jgi:hypothetical protein
MCLEAVRDQDRPLHHENCSLPFWARVTAAQEERQMWRWIRRQLRGSSDDALPEVPVRRSLVFYGLAADAEAPGPGTPSLVLLSFDEVDAQSCFQPPSAPVGERASIDRFRDRLGGILLEGLRDPHTRGRLRFISDWLDEVQPAVVFWTLEPEDHAGSAEGWDEQ